VAAEARSCALPDPVDMSSGRSRSKESAADLASTKLESSKATILRRPVPVKGSLERR
jgi:hypothetical protein